MVEITPQNNEQQERLGYPCELMIFDPNGYHECAALPVFFKGTTKPKLETFCVCLCYFDMSIDAFSQEWYEEKDNIPKVCPKGYTLEQIESKIQLLQEHVKYGNRPIDFANTKNQES